MKAISTASKVKANPSKPSAPGSPDKVDSTTPSPPRIKALGGSGMLIWDMMIINRTAFTVPSIPVNEKDESKIIAATALSAFSPQDAIEAMIASQAVALHFASLECSRRAMLPQQSADVASKLRKDAANSARAMIDMCEALDRRRGKGPQVVRVERVVVNEGGQAVVGNVTNASLPTSPPAPQAIGQGANPISMVEGAPIMTREGEGV